MERPSGRKSAHVGVVSPDVERLMKALEVSRRLPGRVALEAAYTRNGRPVAEHQAHIDAALRSALGGPALASALDALTEARRAG